jgi:hypothetical protein
MPSEKSLKALDTFRFESFGFSGVYNSMAVQRQTNLRKSRRRIHKRVHPKR